MTQGIFLLTFATSALGENAENRRHDSGDGLNPRNIVRNVFII
jgi:hypothetical protein